MNKTNQLVASTWTQLGNVVWYTNAERSMHIVGVNQDNEYVNYFAGSSKFAASLAFVRLGGDLRGKAY